MFKTLRVTVQRYYVNYEKEVYSLVIINIYSNPVVTETLKGPPLKE